MHYALNLRTFVYSHYFYTGLRVASGILGLILLARALSDTPTAITVGIGALCASLMDLPSPLRHKFNEMMAAALLCTAVTLIISLCTPVAWLLLVMLALMSFFASMMVVWGKKSIPLQVAVLFIMTLSMEHDMTPAEALLHSALFLGGSLAYVAYALLVSWLMRHRLKQQVLAEALFELAAYIDIKADFYDARYNLSEQFNQLVRHQSILADRHQAARDLILRDNDSNKDAITVQVHVSMLDVYELVLSTHTDYALLRAHLADSEVLRALHDLAYKAARDIEAVGYAVTRKRASHASIGYEAEMRIVDNELKALALRRQAGEATQEAQAVLRAQRNKIQAIIQAIAALHLATQKVSDTALVWEGAAVLPFLSQQSYDIRLLLSNLNFEAPIFRFALRLSMAIMTGLLIGPHLPYAAHSYWIVLTIVIILKPAYSATKQRRSDRLVGTLIGCTLTALVVHFVHSEALIFGLLFVAMVAYPTFTYLRYRYAVIAVSMMILLEMHLISPSGTHVISERLIDTCVGAGLASLFSFVLPSWEYRSVPGLVRQVLAANLGYMQAGFELLQEKSPTDFPYRIERKRLLDSLANLSASLVRMLDEPPGKRRAVEDINLFIVQNYLLVAHVAALRSLLSRHAQDFPAGAVNALLAHSYRQVRHSLQLALRQLDSANAPFNTAAPAPALPQLQLDQDLAGWSGWPLLRRRIRLLQADADKIAVHSAAIEHTVTPDSGAARQAA
ncbi:MAG TPA: FUSC family membrane protein [Janthinobacterium sp.]|nr:FUSC family membrane protein [Janthinobacterium sp.]